MNRCRDGFAQIRRKERGQELKEGVLDQAIFSCLSSTPALGIIESLDLQWLSQRASFADPIFSLRPGRPTVAGGG